MTEVYHFLRLLFVNVITALETYLSDAFISTVMNDAELIRRFIETAPEFKAAKVSVANVFKAAEAAEGKVKAYLGGVVWHDIRRVIPMYRETINIKFPREISSIFHAVLIRHNIVHRNGRTKDGGEILIKPGDVSDLISSVAAFVQCIDNQLAEAKSKRQLMGGRTAAGGVAD